MKILTSEQVDAMYDADPVLSFVRRVNVRAVASEIWNIDFRRALYDAFAEESRLRVEQQLAQTSAKGA